VKSIKCIFGYHDKVYLSDEECDQRKLMFLFKPWFCKRPECKGRGGHVPMREHPMPPCKPMAESKYSVKEAIKRLDADLLSYPFSCPEMNYMPTTITATTDTRQVFLDKQMDKYWNFCKDALQKYQDREEMECKDTDDYCNNCSAIPETITEFSQSFFAGLERLMKVAPFEVEEKEETEKSYYENYEI
jgi:hypothetical protein